MDNFYQDLIKNKNDIKFIEKLSGKQSSQFDKLIRDEEHFDLLIRSVSSNRLDVMPKISRKLFAKYLVMHHFSLRNDLTTSDLSYISKIVGFYFNKSKKNYCLLNLNLSVDKNEQSGRIHLACYILYRKEYLKITGRNVEQSIKHIKKCFNSNYKTKIIASNIDKIITYLNIIKRDNLFDKFYALK